MSYERLTQLRSHIIIGKKQTLRAMNNNVISEVFIATDADKNVTNQVVQLAKELKIQCTYIDSKKKLGTACGIEVGTSAVGIKQK